MSKPFTRQYLALLLASLALLGLVAASIDSKEPIRVSFKNSGPSYDIDEFETKLTPETSTQEAGPAGQTQPSGSSVGEREDPSENVGRVSIRRIFLVPMMPGPMQPPDSLWPSSSRNLEDSKEVHHARHPLLGGSSDLDNARQAPSLFPFSLSHLLGQDQASRSPDQEQPNQPQPPRASGWSEPPKETDESESAARARFQATVMDPIQMMIDMMHQAIQQHAREFGPSQPEGDLNNEASASKPSSDDRSEVEKPMKPSSESKEEVVEIGGKKYLRKSVISKHVGENMIFMTKKLVFTPLNETDTSVPTTTAQPTSTLSPSTTEIKEVEPTTESPKKEEPTTGSVNSAPIEASSTQAQPEKNAPVETTPAPPTTTTTEATSTTNSSQ